ncbi:MAG: hypothetical protein Q7J68_01915 [Thermoplasmata archaeon]|nr:hypothetical protein [Thermoplasmata archaeon]
MISYGKITIGIVLALLILASVQPAVMADGIPMIRTELHGTLRENRQIAYVRVADSAEFEILDLFLSVVSLDPGNNLTILIPLRTRPTAVSGSQTSEHQFRNERNYNGILNLAEKQNHAVGKVGSSTLDNIGLVARCQMMGIFVMVIGMGGSDGGIHYEIADGVSMDLLSFNSTDSLSEYYEASGVDVPADVAEMIARYGEFNVGVISAVTRPPIDEEKFNRIAERYPTQLEDFRRFVAVTPTISTYGYYDFYEFGRNENPELFSILRSIGDPQLQMDFMELVYATYGQSQVEGTVISFQLPLPDGTAFFPLGTTPAWNGVQNTQVIFRIPDTQIIDFNRNADEVFFAGYHYYVWDFGAESPDYDLEGSVKDAGFVTGLNRFGRHSEQYIYEHSGSLGFAIATAIFIGLWSGGFWALSRFKDWNLRGKKRYLVFLALGALCFAVSFLLTILFGLLMAITCVLLLDQRARPLPTKSGKRKLAWLLGFLLCLTAFLFLAAISITYNFSTAYSIPFTIGFIGVAFLFLHWIFMKNSSYERKLGAWFFYLAMMLPSLLVVTSEIFMGVFCSLSFVMFFLIQTSVYVELIKIEEEEQETMYKQLLKEEWARERGNGTSSLNSRNAIPPHGK